MGGVLRVCIEGEAGVEYRLTLHDLLGRERAARYAESAYVVEMDLSDLQLTAGVYLLRVQSEAGAASRVVMVR